MTAHALRDELLSLRPAELRARLAGGCAVNPAALEGFCYRGTSLGLPRIVERLSWKTFQKTFWRDPDSKRLLGWNVRLHQDGLDAPSRPKTRRSGEPVTTWFYELLGPEDVAVSPSWSPDFSRAAVIDYARAPNGLADTVRFVKDPLVDLSGGRGDLLLGVSAITCAGVCVETPTYFLLEREAPLAFVPERVRRVGQPARALALLSFERRWAELVFDAVLAVDDAQGNLPAFLSLDHRGFWRALDGHTPPYFAPGLRAAVHALNAAPLFMSELRRPLASLSRERRIACVERLAGDPRFVVRQMLATVKILACFAYFEHDAVRAHLGGRGADAMKEQPCAA